MRQNLGQNGPQRRRSPEDEAGEDRQMLRCTDLRTYEWTDPPCVLLDFVPFSIAAQQAALAYVEILVK